MESTPPRRIARGDVGASLARWSLAVVLVWLGAMRLLPDGADALQRILAEHRLVGAFADRLPARLLSVTVGLVQIAAGGLIAFGKRPGIRLRWGALASIVLALLPLSLFFTNPVWVESLGGFPFIGAGQGLLKYATILGVSLYLYSEAASLEQHERLHAPALHVTLGGLLLVLGWIGAMKFTSVEARGIEPLLATSPFLSWMLDLFSLQGTSNLIGVAELVTVALLATWWLKPSLFIWGAALAFATFTTTLSFIVTLPAWHPTIGFPALSGTGQFLIKDLVLLAGVLILLVELPGSGRVGKHGGDGTSADPSHIG